MIFNTFALLFLIFDTGRDRVPLHDVKSKTVGVRLFRLRVLYLLLGHSTGRMVGSRLRPYFCLGNRYFPIVLSPGILDLSGGNRHQRRRARRFQILEFRHSGWLLPRFAITRFTGAALSCRSASLSLRSSSFIMLPTVTTVKPIAVPWANIWLIFFFPTMVAGPIKRYQDFIPCLRNPSTDWAMDWNRGITRILIGLVKKFAVADLLTSLTNHLNRTDIAQAERWALPLWLFAYGWKIYFDFSAYSDIAIGSGRLFGLKIPENFDWPYFRTNITEFWRHWHMSLYK